MYARILTANIDPAEVGIVMGSFNNEFLVAFRQLPGFLHLYVCLERSLGRFIAITVWERVPPDEEIMRVGAPVLQRLRAVGARIEPWHEYEVLASL